MSATFTGAISGVAAALAAVDCPLLSYEPAGFSIEQGKQITLFPEGITPFTWRVQVRLYVGTRSDVEEATATIGTLVTEIEDALPPEVPRGAWETAWTENLASIVATTVVEWPREDVF